MRRGFGLADGVVAVVVVALLWCVIIVTGAQRRGTASQSESLDNLRQIGSITRSYGADYQDRMWGLTWTRTQFGPSQYPDLMAFAGSTDLAAASAQAIDLIRRRASFPAMPYVSSWLPHVSYGHLVLADYLDTSLPMNVFVSPGDRNRRRWAENPAAFRAGQLFPQPDPQDLGNARWIYSSSYEVQPAFWSPDAVTPTTVAVVQGPNHYSFQIASSGSTGSGQLTARPLTQVQFPSHKVLLSDSAQWQGGRRDLYFLSNDARVPLVMVDGSARVRTAGDANPGFNPDSPTSPFYTVVHYERRDWEPFADTPVGGIRGRWRFTRWGLRGRDFDGQEVTAP
jgi:hypothetical protein